MSPCNYDLVAGFNHYVFSISYMGCSPSHWLSYFSRCLKPPTSYDGRHVSHKKIAVRLPRITPEDDPNRAPRRCLVIDCFISWVERIQSMKWYPGLWFGTFYIFPCIGNKVNNWLIFFQRGGSTTNQYQLSVVYWFYGRENYLSNN